MQNEDQGMVEIDLREYLGILKKWRWVIVLITVVAVGTAGVLSFFVLPPVYQAEVTLLVNRTSSTKTTYQQPETLESAVSPFSKLPEMTLNTYVAQVTNPKLLGRVRDNLGLDPEVYTINRLSNMVSASVVKDSNLINIKVEHTDPILAREIADSVSEELLVFISEANEEQLAKSVELLDRQLIEVSAELLTTEEQIKNNEAQPRSLDFVRDELDSAKQMLSKYRSQRVQVDLDIYVLESKLAELNSQLAMIPPTIVTEEISYVEGENGEEQIITRSEQVNPSYTEISRRREETVSELSGKQAEASFLIKEIERLTVRSEELQAEVTEKRVEQEQLARKAAQLEQTYNLLTNTIAETQIVQAINIGETDVMITAPAETPTVPIKPNKSLNMAVAAVLAAMIGIFLAFVLEYFDNTVKTAEDVQKHGGIPTLGSIPRIEPFEK